MKTETNNNTYINKVQVELSEGVLAKLISSGLLHGNECKCLNLAAKKVVWQLLLKSSLLPEPNL